MADPRSERIPVAFTSQGLRILGVLHRPAAPPGSPRPGVVFCHGFTGTKVEPHRLFVKMAEALARAGMVALRFDFRGSGDSEGDFADMTVEGEVADTLAALDFLAAQPDVRRDRLGLVGLSLGGAVAACASGRDARVAATVLLAPVARPDQLARRFEQEPYRELDGRRVRDLGGNLVGEAFFATVARLRPLEAIRAARGPVLLLHGGADEVVPPEHGEAYAAALAEEGRPHRFVLIPGADHTFNRYEWEREVIEQTVAWLVRALG